MPAVLRSARMRRARMMEEAVSAPAQDCRDASSRRAAVWRKLETLFKTPTASRSHTRDAEFAGHAWVAEKCDMDADAFADMWYSFLCTHATGGDENKTDTAVEGYGVPFVHANFTAEPGRVWPVQFPLVETVPVPDPPATIDTVLTSEGKVLGVSGDSKIWKYAIPCSGDAVVYVSATMLGVLAVAPGTPTLEFASRWFVNAADMFVGHKILLVFTDTQVFTVCLRSNRVLCVYQHPWPVAQMRAALIEEATCTVVVAVSGGRPFRLHYRPTAWDEPPVCKPLDSGLVFQTIQVQKDSSGTAYKFTALSLSGVLGVLTIPKPAA